MYWWKVNQNHPEIYKVSSSSYDLLSVVAKHPTRQGRLGADEESRTPNALALGPKPSPYTNSGTSANSARHTSIQAYLDNRITLTVVQATRASILH